MPGNTSASTPSLREVLDVLEAAYDPAWAESWDAVGLVCGDPQAPVSRVLLAVDPAAAVVDEAVGWGADLIVTHHPLFLRPVHGVGADRPKGRTVHTLIRAGVALYTAHTNADIADPGVSDALAELLGLTDVRPLAAAPGDPHDKLVTFVPDGDADRVVDALAAAGAGVIGDYTRCAWTSSGTGTFRAGEGARPVVGTVGAVEQVPETRVEMVLPRHRRLDVVAALRSAHPYEEPAFDLYEVETPPGSRGTGRVGRLARPSTLRGFVEHLADALPATPVGVRVAGDLDRPVETVAVCGGAGDRLLDAARAAGADVYVTADLRHHSASEHLEHGGPALVDAGHWATEWPWLRAAEAVVRSGLQARGATVDTRVSTIVTDPWALVVPGRRRTTAPDDRRSQR